MTTLGHLVREALAAYEDLESLAEDIEDEWTYVTDVAAAWRERIGALIDERGSESVTELEAAAIGRAIDEIGKAHGPAPCHRLALDVPSDRAGRTGRARMRFQDAAQDARAITYAAIQAEPVIAQAAGLLVDATLAQRLLARAVMNGETLDPDGWRTMFPTLFGPTVEPSALERSEAILTVSLAIADRGAQTRDQLRGALVEALTVELLGRRFDDAEDPS